MQHKILFSFSYKMQIQKDEHGRIKKKKLKKIKRKKVSCLGICIAVFTFLL